MLVTIKNKGLATQIHYDTAGKKHVAAVGGSATFDMHPNIYQRYKRENGKRGATMSISSNDDEATLSALGGDGDDAAKGGSFTHGASGGLAQGGDLTAMGGSNTKLISDEQTRRELEGSVPMRPIEHEEIPPERAHDPVSQNAAHAAQAVNEEANAQPVEVAKEPATAVEVLAAIEAGELSQSEQVRLATAVLPPNTLPRSPKPGQIAAVLRKHASK